MQLARDVVPPAVPLVAAPTRRTQLGKIPVNRIEPSGFNPADRTDINNRKFKSLLNYVKAGGLVPPVPLVYDSKRNVYKLFGGHGRTEAHRILGIPEIDAFIVHPNPGESPSAVRDELYAIEHLAKKFTGKQHFQVCLSTKGRIIEGGSSVRRAWNLVQKYVYLQADLEWLELFATPDLLAISDSIVNYSQLYFASIGVEKSTQWRGSFFRNTFYWLNRHGNQAKARRYVKQHISRPTKTLPNAIEKNIPMAVLDQY